MISENFNQILERVYAKSSFQKKKIQQYLSRMDKIFFEEAEEFSIQYVGYLRSQNIPLDYAIDAYLEMCRTMMNCQIEFFKTGEYPLYKSSKAVETVYKNDVQMKSYMIALAISQFLWSTHYVMYKCLTNTLKKSQNKIHSYLEIGPGHGLFLKKASEYLDSKAKLTAIDISPISMEITQSIMNYFSIDKSNIRYYTSDVLKLDLNEKFDFITMGEVLEHVSNPEILLGKLKDLLETNGRVFISTCVNCPAIDHVYHFRTVEQIREMLTKCGFAIEEEHILPVENLPMEEIIKRKITINYCSILQSKRNEQI